MFKTVRLIAGSEDMAMMGNAVEQSRRHFRILEELYPFIKGKIGAKIQSAIKSQDLGYAPYRPITSSCHLPSQSDATAKRAAFVCAPDD